MSVDSCTTYIVTEIQFGRVGVGILAQHPVHCYIHPVEEEWYGREINLLYTSYINA